MNILDMPEGALKISRPSIDWPLFSQEQIYGEALTSDTSAVQDWAKVIGVSAVPGMFTGAKGLLMEWEFIEGFATTWVESHSNPFLDALSQRSETLDPAWVFAAFQGCWPMAIRTLGLTGLRRVQEEMRSESLCYAWSLGSVRFAFTHCDEKIFQRLCTVHRTHRHSLDLFIQGSLRTPNHLWSTSELSSLMPGDAIVLSSAPRQPIRLIWSLGIDCDQAPLVNWNWSMNTMSWSGEIDSTEASSPEALGDADTSIMDLIDLKIPVSFELASSSYALATLKKLHVGQSIDLGCNPFDCTVKMTSLGRSIAKGKLVQIGNSLALRLEQIYIRSEE